MSKPLLFDLCCKAGGASAGYAEYFEVVGVDIEPQPNYPFEFVQMDGLEFLPKYGKDAAALASSPPCQGYSVATLATGTQADHPRLIPAFRQALRATGRPYVIENVFGARRHMIDPVMLCGSSFGKRVQRHRVFETNWDLQGLPCDHDWQNADKIFTVRMGKSRGGSRVSGVVPIFGGLQLLFDGKGSTEKETAVCREALGTPWMTKKEMNQAIPPYYTEYIASQLIQIV